jgi:uncharacterized protein with HEPN domain
LGPDARERTREIPWRKVTGLRHRLVQDYFNINLALIWQITHEDLPEMIRIIEAVVPAEES